MRSVSSAPRAGPASTCATPKTSAVTSASAVARTTRRSDLGIPLQGSPRGLERAAGGGRGEGVLALVADPVACQVLLGQQQVRLGCASYDGQEGGHARDLLALLLQEPVEELRAHELILLTGERGEAADLLGDRLL